ncbi:MAG: hypothetical protein IPN33_16930 [Saprospiraceae bacterium]|nr:hypothetical protein [Saprospiraceae bacterium]
MNRIITGGLLLLLGVLSACGPTLRPFTQQVYEQNRWTDEELKRVQFYLSNDIVMRREINSGTSEIIRGQIKIIDGRQVEEIVIRKGTPGVFLFSPKSDRFAVSFETGGEDRYLVFGPSPKAGNRYVLLASEWNRRDGQVTYEGKKYRVDTESAYASLLVDLRKINKSAVNSRTAEGRKVN